MHTIDDTIHRKSTRETACTRVIMHMVQGIFSVRLGFGCFFLYAGGMRLIRNLKRDLDFGERVGGGRTGWRWVKPVGMCGVAHLIMCLVRFIVASCPGRWPVLLSRAVSRVGRLLARSKLRNRWRRRRRG